MKKIDKLRSIYVESGLSGVVDVRKEDELETHSSLRFKPNDFRMRSIEIWNHAQGDFFRIYYAPEAATDIQEELKSFPGLFKSNSCSKDYRGDFLSVAKSLASFMRSDGGIELAKSHPIVSRAFGYEGLVLPDVDTSETEVIGKVFTWREVIAIAQDDSVENNLKTALSKHGVYLQRSVDGSSRYVGAAYSEGGILQRWMRHLNSNGDAKHLNFFVLENGYANIVFTVLEITETADCTRAAEARWKATLGTSNNGPYDGIRLNCN